VMSLIARTNERFGIGHILDVITGAGTKRIRELGHDGIKTYGAGKHKDKSHWRFIIDELLAQELIRHDGGRYPVLKFTTKGAAVLKGAEQIFGLKREDRKDPKRKKLAESGNFDIALFDRLRTVRRKIAEAHGVPPYIIFSDKTLHEMSRQFPASPSEMRRISGVGDIKLERYGEEFIDEIRAYRNGASPENHN
jgi:ATP-dependent DNA helicase RecQ